MKRSHSNHLLTLAVIALIGLTAASPASAARHPRYLHARSDLRVAQFLLRIRDEENVMRYVRAVDGETEAAIREIDHASVLDRKDLDDHPHYDANLDRPGRFHKVMALLRESRRDIGEEEDNLDAIGWRDAAYRHIDEAIRLLRRAAEELRMDDLEGL